ncbi:MAG: hypothetical protein HY646_17765 [Acidobacteria bacterium]|nr:hypothetical protein [Acidobacteriota bacterium]
MRRRVADLAILALLITPLLVLGAQKKEYFTEDELDTIRDAQEIALRVPAYLKLAERRLVFLGLMEKNEKEKEKERKAQEQYEKEKKKAGDKAASVKPPKDEMAYLADFTRSELLRGYIQTLDEVMSNIDDAYSRKQDVRDALEELEKFSRETLPVVEKFQSKSDNEKLAKEQAAEKAREALEGAKEALTKVPKTEKKKKN